MRFLVDENLPPELADILDRLGHDAFAVVGSGVASFPDEFLWDLAHREDRILVTQDLDFPLNISPKPPGLVLIRFPGRFDVDVQLAHIEAFFADQTSDSLLGKITVCAPGQTRNRDI